MNKIKKQSEVAKELNVSSSYISAILLGKKSCNEKVMNKLNEYYNLQWVQTTRVLNTYKVLGQNEYKLDSKNMNLSYKEIENE